MIDGYIGILRLCMLLFPEADENIFIALNRKKIGKYHTFFGYQSKWTVFIDTINFCSEEVSKWSSELLFCHKYFTALSPVIKMAKCSENEHFSSGTNS